MTLKKKMCNRLKVRPIMKKIKALLCSIVSFVLIFSIPVQAYDPTTDVAYDDTLKPIYIEKSLSNLNNISGDMSTYVIKNTPQCIWDLFIQEGVRIYVTQSVPQSERLSNQNYYNACCYSASLTWNGSNKITKIGAPVSIYIYHDTSRADAYIHECGHALDDISEYITGYYQGQHPISNSTEWQNLYSKYGSTMASFDSNASVNMYKASEGFAEAYRLYFTYPQQLLSRCPEVYSFVSDQIIKYSAYVPALSYDNFDYISYAVTYPDLQAAYGFDKKALWDHYTNFGIKEGRTANKIIKVKR